ncbi:MAG: ABC transporter permease [Anaerolineae bacterium]|nr:ABC transporter permease [Anaerolineae bacterium]
MKILQRLLSLLRIVSKRLLTQPWLVVAKLLGLFVGMTMIFSIPLYADAVNFRMFSNTATSANSRSNFPPFSVMFHYAGAWQGGLNMEDIAKAEAYLNGKAFPNQVGLPVMRAVQFIRTNNYPFYADGDSTFAEDHIAYASLGTIRGFEDNVTLTEGSFDQWETLKNGYIPVMILDIEAEQTGIRQGERFNFLITWRDDDNNKLQAQVPVEVTGIYRQTEEDSDFWYMGGPDTMRERFIMSRANFEGLLAQAMGTEVYSVSWFFTFDHNSLHFNQSSTILKRLTDGEVAAQKTLDGLNMSVSPKGSLVTFTEEAQKLTVYLYIVGAPIVLLILIFIGMVSKIELESRLNEIAILRSRGATRLQITFIEAVEALILGCAAAILATPASLVATHLLGSTRSFLDFSMDASSLRIALNLPMIYTALVMILVTIFAQVIPSLAASRHTVTSYKQQQARLISATWWQRLYLDFALLAVVIFGMTAMRDLQDNTGFFQTISENSILFSLLYLLPILLSIAISLVFLRVLPLILAVVSWVVSKTNNVTFLMAARSMHRMPNAYQMPLLLLIITVNLAVFTTTLAATVDRHLYDQVLYRIGSDLRFTDYGDNPAYGSGSDNFSWAFLPVSTYLDAPGAVAAARLGDYSFTAGFSTSEQGTFFGIDRLGFNKAAFWRDDFSAQDFGSLMNELALHPDGVLVSKAFQEAYGLQYGDLIPVRIDAYGDLVITDLRMVGSFEYFPTWYPEEDGNLLVGNLEHLFSIGNGPYPYYVMVQTDGIINPIETANYFSKIGFISWATGGRASTIIEAAQQEPMRQGFFGLLTISFFITALLSFLGFFLYAVFSLRRRSIELGVLRAIGLSTRQMGATLAWEFMSLIFSGAVIGTLIGIFSSRFFVPYMQIGAEAFEQIPPYYILIAWNQIYEIYGLLLFLFLLLVFALLAFLRKIKIFEAIKLGETV